MYLEISGRQTHKTTHLIRDIHNWLSQSDINVACLTVFRMHYAKDLMYTIREMFPRIDLSRIHIHTDYNAHGRMLRAANRVLRPKYYWDEFDHMTVENVPVMDNGYYTTTAKRGRTLEDWKKWRDDPLLRLLIANDFRYTSCHGFKLFFDYDRGELDTKKLEQLSKHYTPEQFTNEFLSGFDWVENNNKENTQCSHQANCKKSDPSLEPSVRIPESIWVAILKNIVNQGNGGRDIQ